MGCGVTLAHETDFDGFRRAARALLQQRVMPDDVQWAVAGNAKPELFDGSAPALAMQAPGPPVPAGFIELARCVLLHSDAQRLDLLYRLLWRLLHEPGLRHDPLDAQRARARQLAHEVRRDIHKMRAFVRFREVAGEPAQHVAWFEPQHHIVQANAPFFQRRFAGMHWAILTPSRCVRWDGQALQFGPGATPADAPPADAGEALWLRYYESIFNPSRLKLRTMEREMPRRYWPHLPEARLIAPLAAAAAERSAAMVQRTPTPTSRRLPPLRSAAAPAAPAGIDALRAAAARCRDCALGAAATQTVWGEGPVPAPLMLVGEQPGDQEDLQGRPFVGPAGRLLDRALAQLGWDRALIYVTNAVKHFKYEPRGKRRIHKTPAQQEADACQHWLDAEIACVQPQALVALGATAARQLLARPVAVTQQRDAWLRERADGIPVLVTLHPAALLRLPADQHGAAFDAWLRDLALAGSYLQVVDQARAAQLGGGQHHQGGTGLGRPQV